MKRVNAETHGRNRWIDKVMQLTALAMLAIPIMAAANAEESAETELREVSEAFVTNVIGAGWELKPGHGEWLPEGGKTGGVVRIERGSLTGPMIQLEPLKPTPAGPEARFYRMTARVRAEGSPTQRHRRPEGEPPHLGGLTMHFYDSGGRAAPGQWFTRMIVQEAWAEVELLAMAPQWTTQMRVVVEAYPGCVVELDQVSYAYDAEATAAFDGSEPTLLYRPEPDRWRHLPRTMAALREGRPWRVVVLGDSIANDLYHSFFHRRVNAMYPGAQMELIQSVHGSAGWNFFIAEGEEGKEDRVQSFVLDHQPDAIIIAGMSSRDVADLRELVRRIRKGTEAEIIAVSAAVCQANYRASMSAPPEGSVYPVSSRGPLRAAMVEAGRADGFAVFDMGRTWEAFLWNETRPLEWYTRDTSHLNPRGMAVVGRLMTGFLQPDDCDPETAAVTIVRGDDAGQGASVPGDVAPEAEAPAAMPVVGEVVGRLARVSPMPTLAQIAPYTEAYRAVEYEVVGHLAGPVEVGQRIVVIQPVLAARKETAAAAYVVDNHHRLTLSYWEHVPKHDTWPVSDTLEQYDARLYYSLNVQVVEEP